MDFSSFLREAIAEAFKWEAGAHEGTALLTAIGIDVLQRNIYKLEVHQTPQ